MASKTIDLELETEFFEEVDIICPTCKARKNISVAKRIVNESQQLTTILIPSGRICDHMFVAAIDKQFKVRGYEKLAAVADEGPKPQIQTPELKPGDIDVMAIKINIKPICLSSIIRGCLKRTNILLMLEPELEYLKEPIFDFLTFILQKSFSFDIHIMEKSNYKKNKNLYNNRLIISERKVLDSAKEPEPSEFLEDWLIKPFYQDLDVISSLINLRDRLRELYALSFKVVEYYKKEHPKPGDPLNQKKTLQFLEDSHYVKIKKPYFNVLIDVARSYFKSDIVLYQDKVKELLDGMWGS